MNLAIIDKIVLFFINFIGGFLAIHYFVDRILPIHNSWQMYLASTIFAVSIGYLNIRLFLWILGGDIG